MTPTFLVFDTETTGLPPRAPKGAPPIPADDPRQPRLASFAAILCDATGAAIQRYSVLIRPEGWSMAQFDAMARAEGKTPASAVNGLTDERLNADGVPVIEVLHMYSEAILAGMIPVAFNSQFDVKIMRGELRRAGMPDLFEQTRHICMMKAQDAYAADGLCMSAPGFVKLRDACAFHGVMQIDAHTAGGDAEDCRQLLAIAIRDGRLPEPAVNYSSHRAA